MAGTEEPRAERSVGVARPRNERRRDQPCRWLCSATCHSHFLFTKSHYQHDSPDHHRRLGCPGLGHALFVARLAAAGLFGVCDRGRGVRARLLTIRDRRHPADARSTLLSRALGGLCYSTQAGRTDPKPIGRSEIVMWLLLAVLAISGTAVGWEGVPGEPWVNVFRLFSGYLAPMLIYWIVRQSPLESRHLSWLHAGFGAFRRLPGYCRAAGSGQAMVGMFPAYIADPKLGIHFRPGKGTHAACRKLRPEPGCLLLAAWVYRWRFGRFGRLTLALLMPLMLAALIVLYPQRLARLSPSPRRWSLPQHFAAGLRIARWVAWRRRRWWQSGSAIRCDQEPPTRRYHGPKPKKAWTSAAHFLRVVENAPRSSLAGLRFRAVLYSKLPY